MHYIHTHELMPQYKDLIFFTLPRHRRQMFCIHHFMFPYTSKCWDFCLEWFCHIFIHFACPFHYHTFACPIEKKYYNYSQLCECFQRPVHEHSSASLVQYMCFCSGARCVHSAHVLEDHALSESTALCFVTLILSLGYTFIQWFCPDHVYPFSTLLFKISVL